MKRIAFAIALLFAGVAAAQTVLYKWVDAQGKVQYSDRMPKNFKGEVIRIESDPAPIAPLPVAPATVPAAAATDAKEVAPPTDLATKRRLNRERLRAAVDAAEAKLEAARKALAEAEQSTPDDRQVVQQRVAGGTSAVQARPLGNADPTQVPTTGGGMHGVSPRSNCRAAPGSKDLICATTIPKPEYRERIEQLEEAVRAAEENLVLAQRAYRQGAD